MAVDVVPDGKQGSTPENLVGSDAAVCNRIGSGSMSCGRDEPQDSAAKGWVVVTGASGGIGAVLTEQLAKEGYPVVMACRNLEKARPVQQAVMAVSYTQLTQPTISSVYISVVAETIKKYI